MVAVTDITDPARAKTASSVSGAKRIISAVPRKRPRPKDSSSQRKRLRMLSADQLGNTRAVARAHYVHPAVTDGYLEGGLQRFLARWRGRARQGLDRDETALVAYLDQAMRDPLAAIRADR